MNSKDLPYGALDVLLSGAIEAADLCTAVMAGPEFRYVFVNPAFQALRPELPMIGLRYRDVFPEAVLVGAEERFRRVLETGEPWTMERYFAPIAGEPDARWTGEAIRLGDGGPGAAIAVFARNVTEQWRVETALAEAQAALERSNAKLAKTLESMTDGVVVLDRQWRYTLVSERAAELLGANADALIGRRMKDAFPLVDDAIVDGARRAMETQTAQHFETFYPAPLDAWFECHCYPEPDEVTIYFRDVTERRTSAEKTSELKRKLSAAVIAGDVATFEWKIDEDFLWGDPTFLSLFGVEPSESSSAPLARFVDAIHPDDRERVVAAVEHSVRTGAPYQAEYRVLGKSDGPRWVIARGSVEHDAEGRPIRFPGTIVDITERVRTEEALRASEARLREEDARKDRFIATLAHELRNPLAPLRSGLSILRVASDKRDALDRVQPMMERQLDHLTHLVNDLLDLGRVTTGKIDLRREPLDLRIVARHAAETVASLLRTRTLRLDLPEAPVRVLGDDSRLVQIIGNLLQNACKFTSGEGHIELSVAASTHGDEAVITVTDDGIGIPPASLEAIFEMFAQVPGQRAESRSGLGIGLALVRQLVQLHEGRVEAWSEGPGRGARFTVRLPRLASTDVEPGLGHAPLVLEGAGRKVLVVDDNRDAAVSLAAMLELSGWETEIAHDGEEAVARAARSRPQVVLMDLGMPRMDGYEACRRMRREQWGNGIRIVAISGWGQASDRQRSSDAGFDAHLVKPVFGDDLAAALSG